MPLHRLMHAATFKMVDDLKLSIFKREYCVYLSFNVFCSFNSVYNCYGQWDELRNISFSHKAVGLISMFTILYAFQFAILATFSLHLIE